MDIFNAGLKEGAAFEASRPRYGKGAQFTAPGAPRKSRHHPVPRRERSPL